MRLRQPVGPPDPAGARSVCRCDPRRWGPRQPDDGQSPSRTARAA